MTPVAAEVAQIADELKVCLRTTKPDRARIRDLGARLAELGGMELMAAIAAKVCPRSQRNSHIVSLAWDGLGGWWH
jgi:predicted hotdog family 3-hydroxylacyl-ACP dehydratase